MVPRKEEADLSSLRFCASCGGGEGVARRGVCGRGPFGGASGELLERGRIIERVRAGTVEGDRVDKWRKGVDIRQIGSRILIVLILEGCAIAEMWSEATQILWAF